jgi:hypothetical protein
MMADVAETQRLDVPARALRDAVRASAFLAKQLVAPAAAARR